jgi:hypothetical protein
VLTRFEDLLGGCSEIGFGFDPPLARNRSILDSMIELLRLPEVQRVIAFLGALLSFCGTYYLTAQVIMARAMRETPHDGQAGLGAEVWGLMLGFPVAILLYFLIFYLLQVWERKYAQQLDEQERLDSIKSSRNQ